MSTRFTLKDALESLIIAAKQEQQGFLVDNDLALAADPALEAQLTRKMLISLALRMDAIVEHTCVAPNEPNTPSTVFQGAIDDLLYDLDKIIEDRAEPHRYAAE